MTKQTIFSIIIVLLAIAGGVWLTIWAKHYKPVVNPIPVVTDSGESKYLVTKEPQMISIAEDSYLFGIGGSYPQFSQADAAFNKEIADTITGGVADFKTSVNADYQARLATGGDEFQKEFAQGGMYTYEVKAEVIQSNDNYISALIRISGYSGGAHGYHNIITFNYNVERHEHVDISDLQPMYFIAGSAQEKLKEKFRSEGGLDVNIESMISDGTDEKNPENFKNFTFIPGSFTLYFSEYQVAPYVFGEQQVTLEIAEA